MIKIVLKSNEPEYYQVGQTWFFKRKWYTVTYQFTFLWFRFVVLKWKNLHNHLQGSHIPKQSHVLSERLKEQNKPIKASDLNIFKNIELRQKDIRRWPR